MKITVGDVIKAIEENGYVPAKGKYYAYESDASGNLTVIGGCALGQAGLNLKCMPGDIALGLNALDGHNLGNKIIAYNDQPRVKKWSTIAKFVRNLLEPYADREIEVFKTEVVSRKKDA